jgi:rod shape determining protein RodA
MAPWVYGAAIAALVAVLLVGEVRGGTRGWFAVGPFTLQPSEFARLATVVMLAAILGRSEGVWLGLRQALLAVAVVALPVALILLQPDLGIALTYLPVLLAAFWVCGLRAPVWWALALVAVLAAAAAWQWGLQDYQKERVLTVLNPDRDPYGAGYQARQSKIAVGSGSLLGQGVGRGSQSQLRFLPAQHTDFVFAVWSESTGFVGATGLLAAYVLLLWRLLRVTLATRDRSTLLLAAMVTGWIGFQVVVNLGVVVAWLPTTGITLPLMSYGGSSILVTCLGIGLVQGVWSQRLVNQ